MHFSCFLHCPRQLSLLLVTGLCLVQFSLESYSHDDTNQTPEILPITCMHDYRIIGLYTQSYYHYLTIILRNPIEYRHKFLASKDKTKQYFEAAKDLLCQLGRAEQTGEAFQQISLVNVSLFTTQAISRLFLSVLTNASSALLLARTLDLL